MSKAIEEILDKISELEDKLEKELEKEKIEFKINGKKVCFNKDIVKEQKKYAQDLLTYLKNSKILFILTAPIIYALIIPAIILDISVWIYQSINFKVYKIKPVKRSDYIVLDRGYLPYLNIIEKINCLYCGYFNGLIAYVAEVAARTEQYWCPIKHARKIAYRHSRYNRFFPYGDAKAFREKLDKLREELARLEE